MADTYDLAFTGTRRGMNELQRAGVLKVFIMVTAAANGTKVKLHHGCAKGSDMQAHGIMFRRGQSTFKLYPSNDEQRAWAEGQVNRRTHEMEVMPVMEPLVRNRLMNDNTRLLVATPRLVIEERRSGTWATIRHARSLEHQIYIIWPNGVVRSERFEGGAWVSSSL